MPRFRNILFITSLLWAIVAAASETSRFQGASRFQGEWVEQADDPLKISLQPLDANRFEARISHGRSDQAQVVQLHSDGRRLLDESGTPRFALENGKLRQLDTALLVLFVQLR